MKVLLVLLLVMGLCVSAYAAPVTQGGFAYTPVNKTVTGTGNTTATTIWTPATGQKIVLMGGIYSSGSASSFKVESGTSSTGITDIQNTASGTIVLGSNAPIWQGTDDETLTYSVIILPESTTMNSYSLYLWGYETD